MKQSSVFLDACVFFDVIEDERNQTVLNHAHNLNYSLVTSITVMGEIIDQIREHHDRNRFVSALLSLFDEWDIISLYPNTGVAELCYRLATENEDYRVEKTDRVHLGYALAYNCAFFITSDKNLMKYCVPRSFEDAGFIKPETLTLNEFRKHLI